MFCFPQQEHHSSTRILHSFRSHRSLRASAAAQRSPDLYPEDTTTSTMHLPHFHHHRKPSDAPTMSTTRSSSDSTRPSTSGGRSDASSSCSSIEWNPLRLHPPLAPAPRLHQQRSLDSFQQHLQQQNHTQPAPVPSAPRPTLSSHGHSRSAPPALVIYDGFDFGFGKGGKGSEVSTPSTAGSGPGTPAMRRPGPPGGMDGADFFIKRGGWKRRGIVFSPEAGREEAKEDEVFDLEC